MTDNPIATLVVLLKQRGQTVATAESCTGGLLGKQITDISGASAVYPGGIIAYSNTVKAEVLGVDPEILQTHGAVSEPVACQMAQNVRRILKTCYGVGITGIAGPKSDDTNKPVGLIYIAVSDEKMTVCEEFHFSGNRAQIREQSVSAAAKLLLKTMISEQ